MCLLLRTTLHVGSFRRIFYCLRHRLAIPQGQAPPGESQPSCPAHAEFVICDCTIELLYKLWKQEGQVDEWRTANRWRVLCELYAKLIGAVLQHWLMVLFAWQEPQRSLVKLAQVVRETSWTLIRGLARRGSMRSALQRIGRRMQSGCRMNTRQKRPNSAQLIERQGVEWALSWCE